MPDRYGFSATSFGNFTQTGPDTDSHKPVPKRIDHLVFDPVGKKYYGLGSHAVHEVDLENKKSTKMDPGLKVPEISWPCGITYDTKADRLVVATLGGVGYLYTFSPKTGVWAAPADLNNVDLAALVYHNKDNTLYGIANDPRSGHEGYPTLFAYNPQGAVVKQTKLGAPMFSGLIGNSPIDTHVQMTSVDKYIAILVQSGGARDGNGQRKAGTAESFLFLLDPKTEKVKLAWKESR